MSSSHLIPSDPADEVLPPSFAPQHSPLMRAQGLVDLAVQEKNQDPTGRRAAALPPRNGLIGMTQAPSCRCPKPWRCQDAVCTGKSFQTPPLSQ